MKIQSLMAAVALAASSAGAMAQAAPPAPADSTGAQADLVQRVEALTEAQIKGSHDLAGLGRLGQIYAAQNDMQRFAWVLQRSAELLPNSGDLKLQLAMVYARQGDKTRAYDTLIRMQSQGFGYDIAKDQRFDPVHGTKVWDYIVANLQVNAKQFGEGKVAHTLPKGDYLFDALAWDPANKRLLVGSARDGHVRSIDAQGRIADFIVPNAANGLWGVDAMAVDPAHTRLFVASSATAIYQGFNGDNAGKAGIFEFAMPSGKFLRKYAFPESDGAHRLTELVAGGNGAVYAADAGRKQVYKLENGAIRSIFGNDKLTRISGMALSGDGHILYLADYAIGILGFDLATGQAFAPPYDPSRLVLGGIVAMAWYDGTLAIVEDGMVPKRVMRLQLAKDGRSIVSAMPLDVAHPEFTTLGAATIADDKLFYITNYQAALYDIHGVLVEAGKLKPTQIFRSNLRFAWGRSGVSGGPTPIAHDKPGSERKVDFAPGVKPPSEKH
jgi:hypothetical protein